MTLVLADRRVCPFLEADERLQPHPQLRVQPAVRDESCADACARTGGECQPEQLEWVNNCAALQRVFPCVGGCGHQIGLEIPCEVVDPSRDTHGQCLVTDEAVSTCEASYEASRRLCACIGGSGGEGAGYLYG